MKFTGTFGTLLSVSVAGLMACSGASTERSSTRNRNNPTNTPNLRVESIALRIGNQVLGSGAQTTVELFAQYENGDSKKEKGKYDFSNPNLRPRQPFTTNLFESDSLIGSKFLEFKGKERQRIFGAEQL